MSHRTKSALISGKAETWHNEIPCCGWKFDSFFSATAVSKKESLSSMVCTKVVSEMTTWRPYLVVDVRGLSSANGSWKRCKLLLALEGPKKVMLCSCYSLDSNLIESVWQSLDKEEGFLSKFEGIPKRKAKTGLCTHCKN